MTSNPLWCVLPVLVGPEMTEACVADLLAQSVPTQILIINQGVEDTFRRRLERLAEEYPDRIFVWSHVPNLPSLAATWNRALEFVWETGASEAFVSNADVRLHRDYLRCLLRVLRTGDPLFVTGVGVGADQFPGPDACYDEYQWASAFHDGPMYAKGGPDFSSFLISREGHEKYPFDEMFVPAFLEDLDCHRRYLLGGDGHRIYSVNIPYHHIGGGSQTLKTMAPERRATIEAAISRGSRAHYRAKWKGDANTERLTIPFDLSTEQDGVTTPELQHACLST